MSGAEDKATVAAQRGCLVHLPEPDELFVDIDDEASRLRFDAVVQILADRGLVKEAIGTPSPSLKPGREHLRVRLSRPVRDERERVLLQAALGSDGKREACSYFELEAGERDVTCFFELPGWQRPPPPSPPWGKPWCVRVPGPGGSTARHEHAPREIGPTLDEACRDPYGDRASHNRAREEGEL